MIPRPALATLSALLLLGSTALPALAHQTIAMNGGGSRTSAVTQLGSMAVTRSYFAALNHQGRPGHDDQALTRLYAPTVTLTESLTSGRPHTSTGVRSLRAFDQWNQLDWVVYRSQQLSPTVVLTIEGPSVKGPGHEGQGERFLSLFTVRNGQIVNLVWMPC